MGWPIGIPVPFILAWAPGRWWIVAANVKIGLVGPARRGPTVCLNEAAGHVAVGATALVTDYLPPGTACGRPPNGSA
ncbi:hypothetical protein ABZ621_30215 [Streptomyces sp. NPDC007863]|uniref:hypothetical protein n=1 Tax=Streptomyces sp. NPDC007863 TaxID=3154894 RepID=UPI0033D8ED5E